MNEQPLDLKHVFKFVWRRKFFVAFVAVLGLVGGVAYAAHAAPGQTARALVILPPSAVTSTGNPKVDDATQVIIATSTPVLAAAGTSVVPPEAPDALKDHVVVTAVSDDVLQIQVNANSATSAERLANAVATNYVDYVTKTNSSAGSLLAGLHQESAQLTGQILQLQKQINAVSSRLASERASSPEGEADASLLESLRTQQEQSSLQLNNVSSQIFNAQLAGSLTWSGTRVLQSATIIPMSKLRTATLGALGATFGLLAGCVLAVARARRDHRLRLRDEIAAAIGVPVVASIDAGRCQTRKEWERLFARYRPSPVDAWSVRRVVHRIAQQDADPNPELNLLAFADDGPAFAAGVRLAIAASTVGMRAALHVGEDAALTTLRTACSARKVAGSKDEPFTFGPEGTGPDFSVVVLNISFVAIDAANPSIPVCRGANLLALSSGFATAETLARTALAVSDAGCALTGILLVNPEEGDSTTGSLPQGGEARLIVRRPVSRAEREFSGGKSQ